MINKMLNDEIKKINLKNPYELKRKSSNEEND